MIHFAMNLFQCIAACMSVSSLCGTERHWISIVLLVLFYAVLTFLNSIFLLPSIIGLTNYMIDGISGGFPAGILACISVGKDIWKLRGRIVIVAILIMGGCAIVSVINQEWLNSEAPFGIKWLIDAAIGVIVATTCAGFMQ